MISDNFITSYIRYMLILLPNILFYATDYTQVESKYMILIISVIIIIIIRAYCNLFFFIEFEVNIVIVLQDNHLITENFPIKILRF